MFTSKEWLKIAKNIEWDRYAVRQFTFFFWSQVLDSYHNYQNFIDDKFDELMVKYSSQGKIYFRPARKTKQIHKNVYKNLSDIDNIDKFTIKAEYNFDKAEEACNKFFIKDLKELDNSELIKTFKDLYNIIQVFLCASSTTIIMIDRMTDYIQKDIIKPKLKDNEESINELMGDISFSSEIIHYNQEELDLIMLAEKRENIEFEKLFEKHINKYDKMHFFNTNELWTRDKFIKRLDALKSKDLNNEKNKIILSFKNKKKKVKEILNEYNFQNIERKYVEYLQRLIYVRTREEYLLSLIEYVNYLMFNETSRRYPVAISQLNIFTILELFKLFDGKKIDMDSINLRKKISLLVYEKRKMGVFVGEEAENLLEKLVPENIIKEFTGTLKGTSAMKGSAKGKVKVILHPNDLEKFHKGDILVAPNTNPAYVVAMKKAGAIITDEGGVTCHAAIVSRELGIPCVIGTKFATEVFRNNDEVEVDAEQGIVRKIDE